MDLCSIQARNKGPLLLRNSIPHLPFSTSNSRIDVPFSGCRRILQLTVSVDKPKNEYPSFVVTAIGRKNNDSDKSDSSSSSGGRDQSNNEGDDQKGSNPFESNNSKELGSQMSHHQPLNWREFRAGLYIQEQAEIVSNTQEQDQASLSSKSFPQKWAHPISAPENGCLLVATEKLDGVKAFERSVVLLLRSGTRHPLEGPFGIILNSPSVKRIKHMKPTNFELQTTFAECPLHFGGPLHARMFLLRSGENSDIHGFEEVIPGVYFGARNHLDEAAALVKKGVLKLQDFRFFAGYAGWQLDQLREEIQSDYWCVAACSGNLIFGASQNSTEGLWEEILQLMGGRYGELSRKPKPDI